MLRRGRRRALERAFPPSFRGRRRSYRKPEERDATDRASRALGSERIRSNLRPSDLTIPLKSHPESARRRGLNGTAPIGAYSGENPPTEASSRSKVQPAASGIVTSGCQRDWLVKAPPL